MASVVEFDVTGVESGGGGGSEEPKPAVYPAKIIKAEKRTEKSDGTPANDIHVILDLGGDYVWKHTYIGLGDASDWKLAEFIRALGLKDKGRMDLEKLGGKMLRVKINPDTYDGEYQGKVGRLMKAAPDDVLPEAKEQKSNGKANVASAAGEAGTGYPPNDDFPDGYEPEREEDDNPYDDWTDEDLTAEVADRGLTVAGGRGKKRDKLIAALRADDENPISPDDDSDAEPSAESEDDYDQWEVEQLETEVSERELDVPKRPRGKNAEERYATALIDLLRQDDEENPFDPDAE